MTAQIQEVSGLAHRPAGDWRPRAACTAVDPELFFPTAVAGRALANQEAAAKVICRGCPVLAECRQWAIAQLPHGVAGGLTEQERHTARSAGENAEKAIALVDATRREQAAAGRAALRCGHSPAAVARELGVSKRTAQRWAAQIAPVTADGSHGGNRAPVLISHSNTQAGTAMEGHRG